MNLDEYDFIKWLRGEIIKYDTPGSHQVEFDRVITDENGKDYAVYCDTLFSISDSLTKIFHSEVHDWEYLYDKMCQIHEVEIQVYDYDDNQIKFTFDKNQLTKSF